MLEPPGAFYFMCVKHVESWQTFLALTFCRAVSGHAVRVDPWGLGSARLRRHCPRRRRQHTCMYVTLQVGCVTACLT